MWWSSTYHGLWDPHVQRAEICLKEHIQSRLDATVCEKVLFLVSAFCQNFDLWNSTCLVQWPSGSWSTSKKKQPLSDKLQMHHQLFSVAKNGDILYINICVFLYSHALTQQWVFFLLQRKQFSLFPWIYPSLPLHLPVSRLLLSLIKFSMTTC